MPSRQEDVLCANQATITDPALNTALADGVRNIGWVFEGVAWVKTTGATGTTPSVTLQLEVSVNGTDWKVLKAFTAITGASYQADDTDAINLLIRRYSLLRLVATAKSGTTPALTGVQAGVSGKAWV